MQKDAAQIPTTPKPQDALFTFGKKSKGTVEKIIQKEEKNREKHLAEGRPDKAAACQKRLDTYYQVKEREVCRKKILHQNKHEY